MLIATRLVEAARRIERPEDLGEVLREARTAQGLDQMMLAELTGVTQANISRIERGVTTAKLETYLRLLSALGVDLVAVNR